MRFKIRHSERHGVFCIVDEAHRELVRTPEGKIFVTVDSGEAERALAQLQEDDDGCE